MLKKLLLFLYIAPLLAASPRTVKAVSAEEPIRVDGVLSESSWSKAPVQTGFTVMGGKYDPAGKPAIAKEDMRFRVLKGESGLYFGIEAADTTLKSQKRELNGPIWHDDCVELFLAPEKEFSPDKNIREFYQFIVNASGSRFARKNLGGIGAAWSCNWHAAAKQTKTGWTAEIYIPFYPFAGSRSETWRLNVGHDNIGSPETNSAWSPTRNYHIADNFGYLEGVTFDRKFYAPVFRHVRTENNALTGTVQDAGSRTLAVTAIFRQGRKFAGMVADTIGKSGSFSIPVKLPDGKYSMELLLTDGNRIVRSLNREFLYTDSPVRVNVLRPWYRETLYPDEPEEFLAEVRFPGKVKSSRFVLLDRSGKTLAETMVKEGEKLRFSLKGFPAGVYQVKGESYLYTLTVFKEKPFIRIDSGNRLIVGGKPFYPRGFMGCSFLSLPILQENGYNLAHFYTLHQTRTLAEIRLLLDEARRRNIMVLMSPFFQSRNGFFGWKNTEGLFERMTVLVNAMKDHPALFGWYLYDEPRGAEYTAKLKDAYLLLRQLDPAHPVVGCDNSAGGCIAKTGHCDIHALDVYPSPSAAGVLNIPISSVVKSAENVVASVGREMLWYIPQGFDRDCYAKGPRADSRGLNVQEIRASVYGTLAAGAEGIMPFKIGDPTTKIGVRHPNSGIFASEEMKTGFLKRVGPELKALEKVLLSPSFKPSGTGLMRGWRTPDGDWVLIVNPEPVPGKAVLDHPAAFREFGGKRSFPGGKKNFSLQPYEVLILQGER